MSGREGERGEGERCARAVAQAGKEEAGGEAAAAASIRSIECQVRQRAKATHELTLVISRFFLL